MKSEYFQRLSCCLKENTELVILFKSGENCQYFDRNLKENRNDKYKR